MGVCDSCFAESAPEREYEAINNNTASSSSQVNEKTQLMQSYQQPNPMQNGAPPATAVQNAPVPFSSAAPAPAPAPAPFPLSAQASESAPNVPLRDQKSVAPTSAAAQQAPAAANPTPSSTSTTAATVTAGATATTPPMVQQKAAQQLQLQDDPTSGVFEGLELLQKFTNKSSYDTRFIWINMQTNTMHMSQYMTKDRRHKEASLSEVTHVEEARPSKVKSVAPIDPSLCLTINFKRGGGIDLLFKTTADRNEWTAVLKRIITSNQANDAAQAQAHAQAQ